MSKLLPILRIMVCILLAATFFGCATTRSTDTQKETAGQYVDDSVITTKVKAAIFKEPTLKSMQINVETYKGIVQLSGFVDSAQSVTRAGEVARSVAGVTDVKNDLVVK